MKTSRKTIADFTATIANLNQKLQQATMKINTLKITKVTETPKDRPPKWVNGKQFVTPTGNIGPTDTTWI